MKRSDAIAMAACYLMLYIAISVQGQTTYNTRDNQSENWSKVYRNSDTEALEYIQFKSPIESQVKDSEIRSILQLSEDFEFIPFSHYLGKKGMLHERFKLSYLGTPIDHIQIVTHSVNGKMVSFNTNYAPFVFSASVQDGLISDYAAKNLTLQHLNLTPSDLSPSESTNLVYLLTENRYQLSYKCDIYSLANGIRKYIYVDAVSGSILLEENRMHHVESHNDALTRYSGVRTIVTDSTDQGFELSDFSRGAGITTKKLSSSNIIADATPIYNSESFWPLAPYDSYGALDAHWGAEMCFDYFSEVHQRDSYDDEGAGIDVYVNYSLFAANALWTGDEFVFGNGGEEANPFTSIDIVGHEYTHALIDYTADLQNYGVFGAVQESYCDIFGIAIDHYARSNELANFQLGEEANDSPIRSMSNPNEVEHPDTYQGEYWYNGNQDNGGIHTNAEVQNYWFYLLCEGGSGTNDLNDNYYVEPIGMDNATHIAYEALVGYLTPFTSFGDSRIFTLQAAMDLYGECSDEAIAVAAAWHAVGIGEPFDATIALFEPSQTYSCSTPVEISFENNSEFANDYWWTFGNGSSSSSNNPNTTYTEAGTYEVLLIATGSGTCIDQDDLTITIQVADEGILEDSNCLPNNAYDWDTGIKEVDLGSISNISENGSVGHEDYSCTHFTELIATGGYEFRIETFSDEYVGIWIDFNNDLEFTAEEAIYISQTDETIHEAEIVIPLGSTLNTSLRMRIISSEDPIQSPCPETFIAQSEDYRVRIVENTLPPESNFTVSSQYVLPGFSLQFEDISFNSPTSWQWSFPGGSPSSSTEQNPEVTYAEEGIYDVELICSNAFGDDVEIKQFFINVQGELPMCNGTGSSAYEGTLTDMGGSEGNLENEMECTFLIAPPCANEINIVFEERDLFGAHLYVYDGPDDDAFKIGDDDWMPDSLTAYSGQMFIKLFTYDFASLSDGFVAHWTTVYPTVAPIANFEVSDLNPPVSTSVNFQNTSIEEPYSYLWDFGDGNQSTDENPTHTYLEPGTYLVELVAENCFGQDSHTIEITVQDYPDLQFQPSDTIFLRIGCDQVLDTSLRVINQGLGELIFSDLNRTLTTDSIRIACFGTYSTSYRLSRIEMAIAELEFPRTFEFIEPQSPTELAELLPQIDILIWANQSEAPHQPNSALYPFHGYSEIILDFVRSGKVFLATYPKPTEAQKYWEVESPLATSGNTIYDNLPGHPISEEIGNFQSPIGDHPYRILEDNIVNVFGPNDDIDGMPLSTVFYRNEGYGKLLNVSFGFNSNNYHYRKLLGSAARYAGYNPHADWVTNIDIGTTLVAPGDSVDLQFSFSSEGLELGMYYDHVTLVSNNPLQDTTTCIIALEVRGDPQLAFNSDTLFFDPIMIGTHSEQYFTFMNTACGPDTMMLSISSPTESFYALESEITIPPQDLKSVLVRFDTDILGVNDGMLVLDYSYGTDTLFLQGIGTHPPVQSISIDTIHVNQETCSKYVPVQFDIINDGATSLAFDVGHLPTSFYPLSSVRNFLDSGYQQLTDEIYRMFLFEGGHEGFSLHEAGPYSYYHGNILNTNFKDSIPYTGGEIINANYFGPNTSYFTAKYPGLFVVAADLKGAQNYRIEGTLNAENNQLDRILTYVLNYSNGFSEYTGYVYNTIYSDNPSLTHLIITESDSDISHFALQSLETEFVSVSGIENVKRIYQFTFSTELWFTPSMDTHSDTPTRESVDNIFKTFIRWIEPPEENLQVSSQTIAPFSSETIHFDLNTYQDSTDLAIPIYISGNDPYNPADTLIVQLSMPEFACSDFEFEIVDFCAGEVQFKNRSSKPATSYSWDFGDGESSDLESPIHTYDASGNYTISLQVCTNGDCDLIQKELSLILNVPLTEIDCDTDITTSVRHHYPSIVRFGNQEIHSNEVGTNHVNHRCNSQFRANLGETYDFSVLRNHIFSSDMLVWIDFNADGEFEYDEQMVYLYDIGETMEESITIPPSSEIGIPLLMRVLIADLPVPYDMCGDYTFGHIEDYSIVIDSVPGAPVPNISIATVDSCTAHYAFSFESFNDVETLTWDFGDGGTSTDQNPTYTFDAPGTYLISITTYNDAGVGYDEMWLEVYPSGISSVYSNSALNSGSPIIIQADQVGTNSFIWDFGDGSSQTTINPSVLHTYQDGGEYNVTVTTEDEVCFDSASTVIVIDGDVSTSKNPEIDIQIYPNPTSGILFVKTEAEIQEFRLYSPRGEEINISSSRQSSDSYTVSLDGYASGLYNLQIATEQGVISKRVVLQR